MGRSFFVFVLFVLINNLQAQRAGNVYQFLENPYNARIEGLGGHVISLNEPDASLTLINPALINEEMVGQMTFNSVFYYAGINYGYTGYTFKHKKFGVINTGMKYIYYGKFTGTNEAGVKTGDFTAGEFAGNIGWAMRLDSSFSIGVNFKPILSFLSIYQSFGAAIDAGVLYSSKNKLFNAAFVVNNLGLQITKYHTQDEKGPLPLDISVGVTQKLEHAPFRFSITAKSLESFKLIYDSPEDEKEESTLLLQENQPNNQIGEGFDNILRHFILGVEFIPSKNIYASLGYNYRRRQELKFEDSPSAEGFSYGFGVNFKKFRFSYGRATYHNVGGTNYFSMLVDLDDWKKL